MKIPESVRIGGVEYKVCRADQVIVENRACYGSYSSNKTQITIASGIGTAHEKNCLTLWHEILHGIAEHYGIELDDDGGEEIIERFANGIYQVLQDNGRRLFDIVAPAEGPTARPENEQGPCTSDAEDDGGEPAARRGPVFDD